MQDSSPYNRNGIIKNTHISVGKFTYGASDIDIRNYDNPGAEIKIGNFTSIGAQTTILIGGEHRYSTYTTYPFNHPDTMNELGGDGISWKSHSKGNISIGNDVWIGFKVTILSGVTIGNGAVIGSNSLISSDIPPFAVVAGNPSRVLKYRFRSEIRDLMEQLSWWDLENDQIKEITTQLFFEVPTIEKLLELIKKFKK